MRPAQLVISRIGVMWLLEHISPSGGNRAHLAYLVLLEERSFATWTSS